MYKESVNFWFVRDNGDCIGTIHFNIDCEKLLKNEKTQSYDFIRTFLREECSVLLKEWMKKSGLTREEVLDILTPRLHNARINVTTIKIGEIEDDRKKWNREFFNKISVN